MYGGGEKVVEKVANKVQGRKKCATVYGPVLKSAVRLDHTGEGAASVFILLVEKKLIVLWFFFK